MSNTVDNGSAWSKRAKAGIPECMEFFERYGVMLGLTSGAVMGACASAAFGLGTVTEHQIIADHLHAIAANLGTTGAITAGSFWVLGNIASSGSSNVEDSSVFEGSNESSGDEDADSRMRL